MGHDEFHDGFKRPTDVRKIARSERNCPKKTKMINDILKRLNWKIIKGKSKRNVAKLSRKK